MEDGLIDIDIVASLCTSATVYMAGLVGVLYVGHKIEKLCPFLLVVLGEKVGYLTVAAGVENRVVAVAVVLALAPVGARATLLGKTFAASANDVWFVTSGTLFVPLTTYTLSSCFTGAMSKS